MRALRIFLVVATFASIRVSVLASEHPASPEALGDEVGASESEGARESAAPAARPEALERAVQVRQAPVARAPNPAGREGGDPSALTTDSGWDGRWALLFSLNNVLVAPGVLSAPVGFFDTPGIGAAFHLSQDSSLRLGLASSRASNPPTIIEEVMEMGDVRTVIRRHSQPTGPTSRVQLGLGADYVRRLAPSRVAPYAGVGAYAAWARDDRQWRDDITIVDQITSVDDTTQRWDFGIRGLLGAEWRIHQSFAFFAEYELRSSIYRRTAATTSTTIEAVVNDESTLLRSTGSTRQSSWLTASSGLAQGFQLGLAVHFP